MGQGLPASEDDVKAPTDLQREALIATIEKHHPVSGSRLFALMGYSRDAFENLIAASIASGSIKYRTVAHGRSRPWRWFCVHRPFKPKPSKGIFGQPNYASDCHVCDPNLPYR